MNEMELSSESAEIKVDREDIADIIEKLEKEKPEILKKVDNKEELVSSILSYTQVEIRQIEDHHSGPLPAPWTLEQYDRIIPNGAERIMDVFEKQSSHRMALEKKVVGRQTFQSLFGQILGFIIALIVLGAGLLLIFKGHETSGIVLFGIDIVSLVAVFVLGRKEQKKDLKIKE